MTPADTEERDLRALLERAVPQLPAPAQRLESVRARVRRRRRRASGLSGAAALAVGLAALLVPYGGGPVPASPAERGTPAASAPPASGGAPTAPGTAPPTADTGLRVRQFTKLGGLRLRVPRDWFVLAPGGTATVWVSSQALALPAGGCDKALDDFCTPLERSLRPGGVLVQLRFQPDQAQGGPSRAHPFTVHAEDVLTACSAVGGTAQLGTGLVAASGGSAYVAATACLSSPESAQLARVRDVLTTADFT